MNKTINNFVSGAVSSDRVSAINTHGVSKFKTSKDELDMLLDYMNILDKDAAAREAHAKDPQTAMRDFGLTDEEKAAVMSGDEKQIADLVGVSADVRNSILLPQAIY
jgi:hypothetical protein